jgi:hypothetical protein
MKVKPVNMCISLIFVGRLYISERRRKAAQFVKSVVKKFKRFYLLQTF